MDTFDLLCDVCGTKTGEITYDPSNFEGTPDKAALGISSILCDTHR